MAKSKTPNILRDQLGRAIDHSKKPLRIISLVPSITELLSYLGLEQELIGITKFCIKPDHIFKNKPRVGGTKQVHFDRIDQLKPDLIIANKEENTADIVDTLAKKYTVYVSDILSYQDALDMIKDIGILCHIPQRSLQLVHKIEQSFEEIQSLKGRKSFKAAYLVWNNPIMAAGNTTYINSIFELLNIQNSFKHISRYPMVSDSELQETDFDVLFLPSEPFPFKEKHRAEFQKMFPDKKIILVKGEIFSWYGSYMLNIKSSYIKMLELIKE